MKKISKDTTEWIKQMTSPEWMFGPELTEEIKIDLLLFKPLRPIKLYRCIGLFKGEKIFNLNSPEDCWPQQFEKKNYSPPQVTHWTKEINFARKWGFNTDYYFILEAEISPEDILLDTTLIEDSELLSFGLEEQEVVVLPGSFDVMIVETKYPKS